MISGLIYQATLIFRLMRDPRVNLLLKALPIAALIYLITPIDFFFQSTLWMTVWCYGWVVPVYHPVPQDIVQEHKKRSKTHFLVPKR